MAEPEPVSETALHGSQAGVAASIELHNVSFRYAPDEPWIVKDLSLKIEAGESVAIAGPSGCGKTTLLKLMLGQLVPQEGSVSMGGVPLRQLGLRHYREQIGVVMQDDRLFAGSIAENIGLFDAQLDHDRIEEAARRAFLHEEICRMPMGYDTLVGDMGAALSGGQRQRVVLARALYRRPRILFLDEATSHLDTATENAINRAVLQLDMTRIVIAHRQQTLEAMERVIDLFRCSHRWPTLAEKARAA
ncbi:ATP-binding cassette domain-containing protein [Variovorax defluvii]|uniref:ATP-binding cassette domain-containing protein n=1 Tax=Variovorax defluvii TaxID=913761 RepID=UPI0031EA5C9B